MRTTDQDLGRYRDRLQSICGAFEPVPGEGRRAVRGEVSIRRHEDVSVARISQDLREIRRDSACVARDPSDHLFLVGQTRGTAVMCQGDRQTRLKPGGFVLIDAAQPSRFVYEGDGPTMQVSVHLHRAEISRRFGADVAARLAVAETHALAPALNALIPSLEGVEGPVRGGLREAFFQLLAAVLADTPDPEPALLLRAKRLLRDQATDPEFSARTAAAELNMSLRQLQRLFKTTGETPSRALLRLRLEAAAQRLRARPTGAGRTTVSEIAYGVGFNDLSYFNRAFRERFGCAPGTFGQGLQTQLD